MTTEIILEKLLREAQMITLFHKYLGLNISITKWKLQEKQPAAELILQNNMSTN